MDVFKVNNLLKSKPKKVVKLSQDHILKMNEKEEIKKQVRYDKPEKVFMNYKKKTKTKK